MNWTKFSMGYFGSLLILNSIFAYIAFKEGDNIYALNLACAILCAIVIYFDIKKYKKEGTLENKKEGSK